MTDKNLNGITVGDIEGQVCISIGGQNRPLASFIDWKTGMKAVSTILQGVGPSNDITQAGSVRYATAKEELYAKIYIKYLYSQIGTDAEFERIIDTPATAEEQRIKERYNTVVPLFKSGINWYVGS